MCADTLFLCLYCAVALVIVFVIGVVLQPDMGDDIRSHNFEWIRDLFNGSSRGSHAIFFAVASMGLVGLILYIFYTVC